MRGMLIAIALILFTTQVRAELQVGAFANNINPEKFPVSVNGGFTDRIANSVTDPLHVRCLVLDNGQTKLAIAVVDSCMVPLPIHEEAKKLTAQKTGIPTTHILISATHTHTAPTASDTFSSKTNPGYAEFLARKIAEGIEKAHAHRVPAEVGIGVGRDPTQLFNRRYFMKPGTIPPDPFGRTTDQVKMNPGHLAPGILEPAGPTDPDITMIAARTLDGKPIALFSNYSLHYVGGIAPLSADYFGAYAERMRVLVGGDVNFVGAMSNGTSGDVNNVNYRAAAAKREPGEQIKIVTESVAQASMAAYNKIRYSRDVKLAAATQTLNLGVRKPTAEDIAAAKAILAKMGDRSPRTLPEVYAQDTVELVDYPDKVPVLLQAMRVGDLGIAAIPCEVFCDIGLDIKKNSPLKPTCTYSLANGYNGYLPTPKHHALGGYETWRAKSSYLEVSASEQITPVLLELLKTVAK